MQRLLNTTKLFLKNEIINQAKTDITLIIVINIVCLNIPFVL